MKIVEAKLEPDEGDHPPDYSDRGRILFRWYRDPEFCKRGWGIEVYDYDQNSSVYWLEYGTGIEFELKERLELEQEGWYVIEDVYGSVIRYHGECDGETDEEWYLGNIRYATEEEIKAECLS